MHRIAAAALGAINLKQYERNRSKKIEDCLCYEITMLHKSKCYIKRFQNEVDKIGEFISLESFLLRGRNLMEFIFEKSPKGNYVLAGNFFKNGKWEQLKPTKSKMIKNFLKRANAELAHITNQRKYEESDDKKWDTDKIIIEILSCVKIFLENLPPKYKNTEIDKILQIYIA